HPRVPRHRKRGSQGPASAQERVADARRRRRGRPDPGRHPGAAVTPQDALASNKTNPLPDLPVAQGTDSAQNPAADIMTAEESHVVIPPAKEVAKIEKKSAKKKSSRKEVASKKKKGSVVEVSSGVESVKRSRNGFMLQVASYDKMDVARKESEKLKAMDYDAFVDKTAIKGKTFYRVRIGPIAAKGKALEMLDEIQTNDRYSESYVTKE
ncbi:MAG: SPOR domain-containing protein, partial [Bacteroidales bacterium]